MDDMEELGKWTKASGVGRGLEVDKRNKVYKVNGLDASLCLRLSLVVVEEL